MHIKVRYKDGPTTGIDAVAEYIKAYLSYLDAEFEVSVHGDTVNERLEIMKKWRLTPEELDELDS